MTEASESVCLPHTGGYSPDLWPSTNHTLTKIEKITVSNSL